MIWVVIIFFFFSFFFLLLHYIWYLLPITHYVHTTQIVSKSPSRRHVPCCSPTASVRWSPYRRPPSTARWSRSACSSACLPCDRASPKTKCRTHPRELVVKPWRNQRAAPRNAWTACIISPPARPLVSPWRWCARYWSRTRWGTARSRFARSSQVAVWAPGCLCNNLYFIFVT